MLDIGKNRSRLCYHRQRHRKLSILKNDLSNTFLNKITLDRLFNEEVNCLGSFDIMIRKSKIDLNHYITARDMLFI